MPAVLIAVLTNSPYLPTHLFVLLGGVLLGHFDGHLSALGYVSESVAEAETAGAEETFAWKFTTSTISRKVLGFLSGRCSEIDFGVLKFLASAPLFRIENRVSRTSNWNFKPKSFEKLEIRNNFIAGFVDSRDLPLSLIYLCMLAGLTRTVGISKVVISAKPNIELGRANSKLAVHAAAAATRMDQAAIFRPVRFSQVVVFSSCSVVIFLISSSPFRRLMIFLILYCFF